MAGLPPETRLIHRFELSRGDFHRIGQETSALKAALLSIGFPSEASRRALVAAYELGMNVVIHADHGILTMTWRDGALEITAQDRGPGIADIELAMTEGYSTAPDYVREMGFGAGMGLPNVRKASDRFHIESEVGRGTKVFSVIVPGPSDFLGEPYFHSVRLHPEMCRGCTNCIKTCPTEAIRVRAGKAFILEDRCIDCGECIRRCPNHAKIAVSDPLERLEEFDCKIALVPPSFYGTLKEVSPGAVKSALMAYCGFDDVFDVSIAADLVSEVMREYILDHRGDGPFISPACPAVLRLIQVRYPSLLRQVIPCEAPMEIAAWLVKSMAGLGPGKMPAAVFISPCPAKITAARQPVGRGRSLVDAVVSSSAVHSRIAATLDSPREAAAVTVQGKFGLASVRATGFGMGWGSSQGEVSAVGLRGLAVHGVGDVAAVLEELEKGALSGEVDFIEAGACPGGCSGGCLHPENPYVAKMRVSRLAADPGAAAKEPDERVRAIGKDKPQLWFSLSLKPRPIFRLDEDLDRAEQKLHLLRSLQERLPGLDCGACGAPTCRALAEDIVLNRGSVWDCVFVLRDRLRILADEVKDLATRRPPAMAESEDAGEKERW